MNTNLKQAVRWAGKYALLSLIVVGLTFTLKAQISPSRSSLITTLPAFFGVPVRSFGGVADSTDGPLLQTLVAVAANKDADQMAAAVETFIENYPNSRLNPSLRLNLGKHYGSRGQYSLALKHLETAWEASKNLRDDDSKDIADFALAHWTRLLMSMGRLEQLERVFAETEGRVLDGGPLQQMLLRTKESWLLMQKYPAAAYCGIIALKNTAHALFGNNFDELALLNYRTPEATFTMKALKDVGLKFGFNLVPVARLEGDQIVVPSVIHWKQNHFGAIVGMNNGIYQIQDPVYENDLFLTASEINSEASGYFMVHAKQIPASWEVLSDNKAEMILGRSNASNTKDPSDSPCATCPCPPGANPSSPSGPGPKNGSCSSGNCSGNGPSGPGIGGVSKFSGAVAYSSGKPGMAQWRVSEPYINLWLEDMPLTYQPAMGDPIFFSLGYKQRDESLSLDSRIFGFGKSWNSPWLSYVQFTESSAKRYDLRYVTMPGGGMFHYSGDETNYLNNSTMHSFRDEYGSITNVTLTFTDGTQYVYDFFRTDANGDWTDILLSRKVDNQGFVTRFNYASYDPSTQIVRLASVADADGRTTTLNYVVTTPNTANNLVSSITDPYGHSMYLAYNANAQLTNITDVAGLQSGITYNSYGWPGTLTTPYGQTSFTYAQTTNTDEQIYRSVIVTEPDNSRQIFAYYLECAWMSSSPPSTQIPSGTPLDSTLDTTDYNVRNTFYWGRKQAEGRPASLTSFAANDYMYARMRHWLTTDMGIYPVVTETLSIEREPCPNSPSDDCQLTWYNYEGKYTPSTRAHQIQPSLMAKVLPNGLTWFEFYQRDSSGHATQITDTYTLANGSVGTRTNYFIYDSTYGLDLMQIRGPAYELLTSYTYNSHHQMLTENQYVNASTYYTTTWTYDSLFRPYTVQTPGGLVSVYTYYPYTSPTDQNNYRVSKIVEQTTGGTPIRTNSFTWLNGYPRTQTDPRGLIQTFTYDGLGRLTQIDYPDATYVQYSYSLLSGYGFNNTGSAISILDLTGVRDRLGHWTRYGYSRVRNRVSETDPLTHTTLYDYCGCGSPSVIADALQNTTTFYYDNNGRKTEVLYPDNTYEVYQYNRLGQLEIVSDTLGSRTNFYNNQGLLAKVGNSAGQVARFDYDIRDRAATTTDANGVTVTQTFDWVGRPLIRTYPDGGVEGFIYNDRGVIYYTNQLHKLTQYAYDVSGRKITEITPKTESTGYTYTPAGDLLTLQDGKTQTTTWGYDIYGRIVSKKYANNVTNLIYTYDPAGRLTNRWTQAKGNTGYAYDDANNLTRINYSTNTDISLSYNAVNRLTNMVDAAGTTRYTYTSAGDLLTEDSPWSSDTVTYSYHSTVPHLRVGLSLQQPASSWAQTYGYDASKRLQTVTGGPGTFTYTYKGAGRLWTNLALPNSSRITNAYDSVARLAGTWLKTSANATLNYHGYANNQGGQRSQQTRTDLSYVDYLYDNDGQLASASGHNSDGTLISTEQKGYTYDAAWNLQYRTNNGTVSELTLNNLNQITAGLGGTWSYDSNGNLSGDGARTYSYDEDNLVTQIYWGSGTYRTDLVYDGLQRLRKRIQYFYNSGGVWGWISEVHFIYDGRRVIQERDVNNAPTVSYTRGLDLSGSLEGAGGIGGMLARTHGYSAGSWTTHHCYQADGNGNITAMVDGSQALSATYRYDSYGATLSSSGSMAGANMYRFSSKEYLSSEALYNYGFRYYNPVSQRWLNRDPIGERGGLNLYRFVKNNPNYFIDPDGDSAFTTVLPWAGGLSISDGPLPIGDVIGGCLVAGAIAADCIYYATRKRAKCDPISRVKTNPGRDGSGKCKPCPPPISWTAPGNEHGATAGFHWHWIEYNQDLDTCECHPIRRSGATPPSIIPPIDTQSQRNRYW
jgi:RHS repeat-associated protein